ncbi:MULTISPECIES: CcoQ/FixQ family Cbb3-type cytochrome c oxidase assembly chaperone [Labrys]|jgi:cytochrome c oxidase cbb3-type subunit 4|uniref:CcoQ/FixQ family Cbb3-type cytochrome c oxidase assembly chaperone n=1 Tax=Labrys TaxID=204476 RepID=UPI00083281D7|nr:MULTISPECIES: CcoQ/FixQ family Cbb3-type cytochrome c oxidase assembly chaperone [unclassified Labrys (in: a-proteobacteria)]MDZ5454203.1 CcoQ/FixQ family Cbb3-type cytochrome c oxidase assembly chaperone [Labrys sp. ZIDIC5]OCC06858.1 nitrogen fixation protein FixQ [Labrys sp. WJW]
MDFDHQSVVAFSKSWGLFYLVGLSIAVTIYALWPGKKAEFDRAASSILDTTDRPGR